MKPFARSQAIIILLIALSAWGTMPSSAQPILKLYRIINNWPTIELYLRVDCDGKQIFFTDRKYFRVYENGREIPEFELWCPDHVMRCSVSTSIVLDDAESTSPTAYDSIRAAARVFVDRLDNVLDQSSIVSASSGNTVQCPMTERVDLMNAAIDSMPRTGKRALWDGLFSGLLEIIQNGINQCRTVLLFAGGRDEDSRRSLSEIIGLANRNRIRIFAFGFGGELEENSLKLVAFATGGMYFRNPSLANIAEVFEKISTIEFGFTDCVITYSTSCMDGTRRIVDLVVRDTCGGQDTKTDSYKALKDTSTFAPLSIRLGSGTILDGQRVTLPLEIFAFGRYDSVMLARSVFEIAFDTGLVSFESIEAPAGSLLAGVPMAGIPTAGGIEFHVTEDRLVNLDSPPSLLANLSFRVKDVESRDTISIPVTLTRWSFGSGCFRPLLTSGSIIRVPHDPPEIVFTILAPPSLRWNWQRRDYFPNPVTVEMLLSNIGGSATRNARAEISVSDRDLVLFSPLADSQPASPPDIDSTAISAVRWDLLAFPRSHADTVFVKFTASFDNHPDLTGRVRIFIPDTGAVTDADPPPAQPRLGLFGSHPNPLSIRSGSGSRIRYSLTVPGRVRLVVLDLLGREARLLVDDIQAAGLHEARFVPDGLAPGVYIARLSTTDRSISRTVIVTQ